MNDEFLYRYRQRPRPEFVESLYERISAEPRVSISFVPMRRLAGNAMIMGVVFLLMLACSPDGRAHLRSQIAKPG